MFHQRLSKHLKFKKKLATNFKIKIVKICYSVFCKLAHRPRVPSFVRIRKKTVGGIAIWKQFDNTERQPDIKHLDHKLHWLQDHKLHWLQAVELIHRFSIPSVSLSQTFLSINHILTKLRRWKLSNYETPCSWESCHSVSWFYTC